MDRPLRHRIIGTSLLQAKVCATFRYSCEFRRKDALQRQNAFVSEPQLPPNDQSPYAASSIKQANLVSFDASQAKDRSLPLSLSLFTFELLCGRVRCSGNQAQPKDCWSLKRLQGTRLRFGVAGWLCCGIPDPALHSNPPIRVHRNPGRPPPAQSNSHKHRWSHLSVQGSESPCFEVRYLGPYRETRPCPTCRSRDRCPKGAARR